MTCLKVSGFIRWLYLVVGAFVALSIGAASVMAQTEKQSEARSVACTNAVYGHIVDSVTHRPLAGAEVYEGGSVVALSDAEGLFYIQQICASTITLQMGRGDYESLNKELRVTWQDFFRNRTYCKNK